MRCGGGEWGFRSDWPVRQDVPGWRLFRFGGKSGVQESEALAGDLRWRTAQMARLEAALFVGGEILSSKRIAQIAQLADAREVRKLVEQLNRAYVESGSALQIVRLGPGYQLLTKPEFMTWIDRIHPRTGFQKLSAAAMETLVIIAYRQPMTRADVEALRGVQCGEMIKQLMDKSLVRIAGEHDSLGRPFLYGTTAKFLEMFGLESLSQLPRLGGESGGGDGIGERDEAA